MHNDNLWKDLTFLRDEYKMQKEGNFYLVFDGSSNLRSLLYFHVVCS